MDTIDSDGAPLDPSNDTGTHTGTDVTSKSDHRPRSIPADRD